MLWLVQADRGCTLSAVAFDSLEYAHQLEAVGMPREQAEVAAKGVTRMFIHNFDSLVTKDYLESRFAASDAAIQARFADFRLEISGNSRKFTARRAIYAARSDCTPGCWPC